MDGQCFGFWKSEGMEVRMCKLGDIIKLKPLLKRWQAEANSFNLDMDIDYFMVELHNMVSSETCGVIILTSKKDRPLGFMGLVQASPLSEKNKIMNEHYWYIEPEHRGGRNSLLMINKALEIAKQMGCTRFSITASRIASDLHDKVCRIYERLGFEQYETAFMKVV